MSIWTQIPDEYDGKPIAKATLHKMPDWLLFMSYYSPMRWFFSDIFREQVDAWYEGSPVAPTRVGPGVWASEYLYEERPETRNALDMASQLQPLVRGVPTSDNGKIWEKYATLIKLLSALLLGFALLWLFRFTNAQRIIKVNTKKLF